PSWRYQSAMVGATPVTQCLQQVRFDYARPWDQRSVGSTFTTWWKDVGALIDAGRTDEAQTLLDRMVPWDNYEYARVALRRADIARANGDRRGELRWLNDAWMLRDDLEPKGLGGVLNEIFGLQVHLGLVGEALSTYRLLEKEFPSVITGPERKVAEQLVA